MRIPLLPRRLAPVLALLLAALAVVPSQAAAEDVGHKIIRLCAEAKSLSGFPPSAYAKALKEISPTTEEYSECGQLIRQAQAASAAGNSSSAGGGGSTGLTAAIQATPAEQASIAAAAKSGSAPVDLDGQEVHPGVVHADVSSALSTLPTPLLVLLAFLLACLVAFCGGFARKRFRGGSAD
jgi:hypothetical protein